MGNRKAAYRFRFILRVIFGYLIINCFIGIVLSLYVGIVNNTIAESLSIIFFITIGLIILFVIYNFYMHQAIDYQLIDDSIGFTFMNDRKLEIDRNEISEIHISSVRVVLYLNNKKRISIYKRYASISANQLEAFFSQTNFPKAVYRSTIY